jgi:cytochrome c-type biogenesis protein CcmF
LPVLGTASVWAAFLACLAGIAAYLLYRRTADVRQARLVRLCGLVVGFMAVTAVLTLWVLLLEGDFHVLYVAQESSRETPILYRFTALWSGDSGSLLLWGTVLSGFMAWAALHRRPAADAALTLHALPILLAIGAFFFGLLALVVPPFATTPLNVYDGAGPNALLQNGTVAIHPPLLYMGYVGMALPFALGMASLALRRQDAAWIRLSRGAATFSWLVLGTGILLGAHWAYTELGWGGYWAWDPVENASLMPWLTTTALLHAFVVQERRGILRLWTVVLLAASFWLTILGTFLTRSGILDSVHAFAGTGLGIYFGPFLGVGVIATAVYLHRNRDQLLARAGEEERRPKESAFLLNNLVIVATTGAILLGTLLPLITSPLTGHAQALGTNGYNRMVTPFAVIGLVLLGVATSMTWGAETARRVARRLAVPVVAAAAFGVFLLAYGVRDATAWSIDTAGVFACLCILADLRRRVQARRRSTGEPALVALREMAAAERRVWGGYLVHIAAVVILIGIAGSSVYGREVVATLRPGQAVRVAGYTLRYGGVSLSYPGNLEDLSARVTVTGGGGRQTIAPSEVIFPGEPGPVAGVSILSSLGGDLYTVLEAVAPQPHGPTLVTLEVFVNPLVDFIWFGGGLFLLGGLWVWWPRRVRASAAQARKEGVAA